MRSDSDKFTVRIWASCPARMPHLIQLAAAQQCMKPAEYVRRAVAERLRADGLDPATITGEAA